MVVIPSQSPGRCSYHWDPGRWSRLPERSSRSQENSEFG